MAKLTCVYRSDDMSSVKFGKRQLPLAASGDNNLMVRKKYSSVYSTSGDRSSALSVFRSTTDCPVICMKSGDFPPTIRALFRVENGRSQCCLHTMWYVKMFCAMVCLPLFCYKLDDGECRISTRSKRLMVFGLSLLSSTQSNRNENFWLHRPALLQYFCSTIFFCVAHINWKVKTFNLGNISTYTPISVRF